MRTVSIAVPCSLVLALAACGGGGGPESAGLNPVAVASAPVPTMPPAPLVIDGFTHVPVVGEMSVPRPPLGAAILVTAPGYLPREQSFDATPIALWPGNPEYVAQMVYSWRFTDGRVVLLRWDRPFVVTLDGDLAEEPNIVAKVEEALAEVRRVTGLECTIGPNGPVTISLDPDILDANAVGEASINTRANAIVSARLLFSDRAQILGNHRAAYHNTLLHEFGHALGLMHSSDDHDVMRPYRVQGARVGQFSEAESVLLHMMYAHRRPGNTPLDRDPALGARSAGRTETFTIRE
jgi:hypothetical protein